MKRVIRTAENIESGVVGDIVKKFLNILDNVTKSLGNDYGLQSKVVKENADGSYVIQTVRKDGRKMRSLVKPKDDGTVDMKYKLDTGVVLDKEDKGVKPEKVVETIVETCEEDEFFAQGSE